ncbi:O-methyltransferase [Mycena amicta]|nr:O-methyltransferase [Mycena amicta]
MATDGIKTLRALARIINESLDTMESAYGKAGQAVPPLDAAFDPSNPAEKVRQEPAVATAILNIMAATSQMSATVCAPAASVLNASQAFHISSCLRTASELNVVEILREAGPQGLHIKDIAAPSKSDPALLARILRLLATHNIFREVSPNVFANNRISTALDKGKSPSVLFEKRPERLLGTNGVAALVEFFSEDIFKSSAWLADTILEPKEGVLPYNKAFDTDLPLYYYMQKPENLYRLQRFGLGMQGTAATEAPDAIFTGFEWGSLPTGGLLVDVGGGNGFTAMTIAQKHPKLKVVVQDLDVEGAKTASCFVVVLWKESFPSHVEKNLVEFQAYDFFNPQPVKNADVLMLRYIAHNWSDDRFVKILQNMRDAAQPKTKLIIIEKILSLASAAPATDIPGAQKPAAPAPLLPNWGVGTAEFYFYDMAVHTMLGGGERTLAGFVEVLGKGNWKVVSVHQCVGSQLSHIVAVPV